MLVPKTDYWADDTLGGLIVHQQWYLPSGSSTNVDIKLSAPF